MIYLLVMYIYNHSSMLQKPDVWQIMASSMVDPALIFLCPIQICPPPPLNIILRKNIPSNPMLTSYKLWKRICLRNDLPLGKLK